MSRLRRLLSVVCLGAAATAACFAAERNPIRPVPHPGASSASSESARIIVKLRDRTHALGAASAAADRVRAAGVLGARLHLALEDGRALGPRTQVLMGRGVSSAALADRLQREADVEWAVVDERRYPNFVPNDPLFPNGLPPNTPQVGQWYLRTPNAPDNLEGVSAIDAEAAWDLTVGTSAVVIADIDTGVTQHPELAGAFFPNSSGGTWPPYGYDFVGYGDNGSGSIPTANDGDGDDPDPSDPGDWISAADQNQSYFPASDCPVENSSWHGTQTAGILSAEINNATGMAGIASGARLVPVRALGKCGGYDSDIIAGLQWAAGIAVPGVPANLHPARIINMSLGTSGACKASYVEAFAAVTARNVLVVVSAGNDEGLPVGAPANCPGALGVAALRQAGDKVGFSNIGPEIAISAPGGNCVNPGLSDPCLFPILTTMNTGATGPGSATFTTGTFEPSVGTSFAAPIVAGTAALMLSVAPGLTASQVRSMIQSSATPFPTTGGSEGTPVCQAPNASLPQDECYCTTSTCGAGMLNARAAVSAAALLATTQALVTADSTVLPAGSSLVLSGTSSTAAPGRTITGYQWQVTTGGSSIATLSATTGSTVTLTGVSGGAVTVQMTVTDSAGATSTTSQVFSVTTPAGGGDDGGGGAASPLWLLALGLGAVLLAPRRRVAR